LSTWDLLVRRSVMSTENRAGTREWIGLLILALPTLLVSLDVSVMILALPDIGASLGADSAQQLVPHARHPEAW
jgi:DHA2 family multidrug resistance protein-like MFS transporter